MKTHVKVIPNSKKQGVEELKSRDSSHQTMIVHVKEPAEKGKANKAIINLLKKHFKKKVRIVSGFKSRRKVVEVED